MAAPSPSPAAPPVRWGYLGAGFIAREALVPAAAAAPHAELVAVASRSINRARALVPAGGRAYDDYDALVADPDVEAVYISLTNELHRPWTIRALEAGKHVLCEKPLGMSVADVRAMAAAAAASERLLVEASWYRWHPRTQRAIELLESGRFGRPVAIDAAFAFRGVAPENFRWLRRHGGGALYDLAAYPLAAALWATGRPPVEADDGVEADDEVESLEAAVRWGPGGVDASTTVRVRLGATVADVFMSIDDDEDQHLAIRTEFGELTLSSPVFTSRDQPSSLTARRDDGTDTVLEDFGPVDPYVVMLDTVSRAVRGDRSAWVMPLAESLRTAELVEAVQAASGPPP